MLNTQQYFRFQFGSYGQMFDNNNPSNDLTKRTIGSICFGPTGNIQGTYYFMSINTGCRISRNQFHLLPIPAEVIKYINSIYKHQEQPKQMIFMDGRHRLFDDYVDDVAILKGEEIVVDQNRDD